MKRNILKTTCLVLAACGLVNCTGNYEDYNKDPYAIYKADPAILLPTMIDGISYIQQNDSQMIDQMVGSLGGYYTLSNRWGGQNFDTFNPSDGWNAIPYNTMYEDIYANFFDISKSTNRSGHFFAVASLVRAAVMMRVADIYGGIPYSEVKEGSFYVPYDTCEQVYENIVKDLEYASSTLNDYVTQFPGSKPMGSGDALFSGDYAGWVRYANSLILRAAVRTGNQQLAEAACTRAGGLIETNAQNAMMSAGVQGNPFQLACASWGDLRVNASIVDYMTGYADPRADKYFQKVGDKYVGMRAGTANFNKGEVTGVYSNMNLVSTDAIPVFLAAETNFLRAEMAVRGWAVEKSAKEYYETGVRLSMEQYGVAADAANTYLEDNKKVPAGHKNDPRGASQDYTRKTKITVKWDEGASEDQKIERIITQKWIANYMMGLEAWAEFRRTGYPELTPAVDNLSNGVITDNFRGMRRLRYPFTEKNLNKTNYDAAVAAMGGVDNESVDLFWAKKK